MGTFIARRLLQSIITLILTSFLVFAIIAAVPGGPAACQATPGRIQTLTEKYNCLYRFGMLWQTKDASHPEFHYKDIFSRWAQWAEGLVTLNLGPSAAADQRPVAGIIGERIPATVLLMLTSYILQELIALPMGIYAALRRYSFADQAFTVLSYIGISLPTFWFGIMLILLFAVQLNWLPTGFAISQNATFHLNGTTVLPSWLAPSYWSWWQHYPLAAFKDLITHLALPAIMLAIVGVAYDSRFMRSSMLEVINQDYIRTAKAKGLSPRVVVFKHALRNAILPIVTNFALELPSLLGGAIVTETIFNWPGLGRLLFERLTQSDFPVLQDLLMMTAVATILANLLADLMYGWVDPRIRYD